MEHHDVIPHELGFRNLVRLSIRSFSAKPLRTVLTVLGTSVGIATVVVLVSLGYGLQDILLGKLITTPQSLITCCATYPSDSNIVIDQAKVDQVKAMADVAVVSPVAEFSGAVSMPGGSSGLVLVDIADPDYFDLSGSLPDIGKPFGPSGGVVISSQALRLLNLSSTPSTIGKQVLVTAFYPGPNNGPAYDVTSTSLLPVTGIVANDTLSPTVVVSANSLPKAPPFYKEVYVEAKNDATFTNLRSSLLGQGFIISAHIDLVRQAQQVTNIITIILGVFGIAALIVSAIGMFNTMIVGFLERTYEVGVMKALGATDKDVKMLFLTEAVVMGLAGGVVGIGLGVGIGQLFNFVVSLIAERYGGVAFALFVSPLWFILVVIAVSGLIGFAAGFIPARRASSLSPKEAFVKK
ncbi:MAG TPA: ABC transporter permease [Candidatus Paceibacterota bacterium]|nr:ABC transporter permease [Candidatus Paceibacterota bacterium]